MVASHSSRSWLVAAPGHCALIMVAVLVRLNGSIEPTVPLTLDLVSPAPAPQQLLLVEHAQRALGIRFRQRGTRSRPTAVPPPTQQPARPLSPEPTELEIA